MMPTADTAPSVPFRRSLRLARAASAPDRQRQTRAFVESTLDAFLDSHQRRVEAELQDEPIDVQLTRLASWLTVAAAWKIGAVEQAMTWLGADDAGAEVGDRLNVPQRNS